MESIIDKSPLELEGIRKHIFLTYANLRYGMGIMGLAFPLVLWWGGMFLTGTCLLDSMSAYYHSPMQDAFVGFLFAIGPFLYFYRGYRRKGESFIKENIALNIAGIFAICIALFPMDIEDVIATCNEASSPLVQVPNMTDWLNFKLTESITITPGTIHGLSALLFFLSIGYVCIFRAPDTLENLQDKTHARNYRTLYYIYGFGMIGSIVISIGLKELAQYRDIWVFMLEFLAIWFFSFFWVTKTFEIKEIRNQRQEHEAEIEIGVFQGSSSIF